MSKTDRLLLHGMEGEITNNKTISGSDECHEKESKTGWMQRLLRWDSRGGSSETPQAKTDRTRSQPHDHLGKEGCGGEGALIHELT